MSGYTIPTFITRSLRVGALAAMLPSGLGCGAHLHNPKRHAIAEQAKEAFDAAQLGASFDGEYALMQTLSSAELEAARRHSIAAFETRLLSLLEGETKEKSWDLLTEAISTRCFALDSTAGENCSSPLATKKKAIEDSRGELSRKEHDLAIETSRAGLSRVTCTPDGTVSPTHPSMANALQHEEFVKACGELSAAEGELAQLEDALGGSGLIVALQGERKKVADFEVKAKQELKKLKDLHKDSKDAYKAALKGDDAGKLAEAEATLAKALDAYDQLGVLLAAKGVDVSEFSDLALVVPIAKLKIQLASIDAVLKVRLDPKADSKLSDSERVALVSLEVVDSLAALVRSALDKGEVPSPSALLIRSRALANELAYLERKLERAKAKQGLIDAQLAAAFLELDFLSDAAKSRAMLEKGCAVDKSLAENLRVYRADPATQPCARQTAEVLIAWGNARVLGEAQAYARIALEHELAVDASQAAARQWQSLLEIPLAQLVAYHQAGFDSADLYKVLEVLGLGAIAVGAIK